MAEIGARGLVAAMCAAEVLGMAATQTFSALLPTFIAEWTLTNTEAGWLNGVFYAGYTAAVAVLLSLTDRMDPRRVYLAGTAVSGLAALGFALLARGFWTALAFRAAAGVGLAGSYMPGLRILSDRIIGARQGRYMSFYTASFGIGSAASVFAAGLLADRLGWPAAFALSALGPAAAIALIMLVVPGVPAPARPPEAIALLDFRPVLRNRRAMGYALGYAAHTWELFGFRSWMTAFLAVAAGIGAGEDLSPVTNVVTAILLLGVGASILGNEAAERFGRRRALTVAMLASAVLASTVGFTVSLPFPLVAALLALYGFVLMTDSASLTVGAVTAAEPGRKGATMAVHSLLGFGAAFLGPLGFGAVLDLAGGSGPLAWGLAFASLGAVVTLGPLALWWAWRRQP